MAFLFSNSKQYLQEYNQEKQEDKLNKMDEGNPNHRSVYLVTYSKADEDWSRQSFADVVVGSFEVEAAGCKVLHRVCSREMHYSINESTPLTPPDHHYQLAIKLDHKKRWQRIRNKLA